MNLLKSRIPALLVFVPSHLPYDPILEQWPFKLAIICWQEVFVHQRSQAELILQEMYIFNCQ